MVEISDDDLATYRGWAEYNGWELSELLAAVMAIAKKGHRGSVPVEIVVPESELERWHAEARRHGWYVPEWLRRMGNFVIATGLREGQVFSRGHVMTALWVGTCAWCNAELPELCTARRVFCSDRCRVESWRALQRQRKADSEGAVGRAAE